MGFSCTECGRYIGEFEDIRFKIKTGIIDFKQFCSEGCKRKYQEHSGLPDKNAAQQPMTAEQVLAQAELERTRHEIDKQKRAAIDKEDKEFIAAAIKYWKIWVPIAAIIAGWIIYSMNMVNPQANNAEKEWATISNSIKGSKDEIDTSSENAQPAKDDKEEKYAEKAEVAPPVAETPAEVSMQGTGTIMVEQAHFYQEANAETKRKAYLIKGQQVSITEEQGDFVYCSFTSNEGKRTEGWILKSELK